MTTRLETVRSLLDLLREHAADVPDRVAFRFPGAPTGSPFVLTYGDLERETAALGAALRGIVEPGDRVLLAHHSPAHFVPALMACMSAGAIAVPTPLGERTPSRAALNQAESIARDVEPRVGLTSTLEWTGADGLAPSLLATRWLTRESLIACEPEDERGWPPDPSTPAVLQYTSGSTSDPKGVIVTHANIVDQVGLLGRAFNLGRDTVVPSWLPLYHDMGLVATVMAPMAAGSQGVLVTPQDFLRDPLIWLRLITDYGGNVCGAPDFAYSLCARRATAEAVAELDLSTWRLAWNGAEPILPRTLDRFSETFAEAGFRREVFYPCFGMAEATLMVSGRQAPVVRRFARSGLERGLAIEATGEQKASLLAGSGRPDHGQHVEIVEPDTCAALGPGAVGEVWITGPSVTAGYWRQPEVSEATFDARIDGDDPRGYLRTGDAGFLLDGELFINGRLKDLIVIRGANVFPQDVELSVEATDPVLRAGRGAVFGITDGGAERLVVVHELREAGDDIDLDDLARRVRDAVGRDHGLVPAAVVLIGAGSLPKTSSGKVQRSTTRARYLAGELPVVIEHRVPIED